MQGRGLPWCRQPEQILYFFLGLSVVQEETGTTARFALRLGPSTFGIFDAFPDESGRQAHLSGRVAAALMARAPELFSQPPLIEKVTAFFSSPDKEAEAKGFGADHFINSRDPEALTRAANSFDFILSTVNVPLDWPARNLCPPVRREVGRRLRTMLDFAARHHIQPTVESYRFSEINEALEKLRHGKPRYRIVLKP